MSNEYNIGPVNFEKADKYLFLDSPIIKVKVRGDAAWTSFKSLGYIKPEVQFTTKREYAEFSEGIPETVVAKTCTKVSRLFKCTMKQFQPETLAMLQAGVVEDKTTETYVHIGSESPAQLELSIWVQGKTLNGKALNLYIRKAIPTPESVDIKMGGKDYSDMDFEAEVVVDDDPLASNFDWRCFGEVETTASTTSADDDITVASATGLSTGMRAYGSGIPADATILNISGTTVTLSANATVTGSSVTVKFVTEENMLKSDVAYWKTVN